MRNLIGLLLLTSCQITLADEPVKTYLKLSYESILSQPSGVTLTDNTSKKESKLILYSGDRAAYTVEYGIAIPTIDNEDVVSIGISWHDLYNQGGSRENHRPYRLEVFYDYTWQYSHGLFLKVGAGVKVLEQDCIQISQKECVDFSSNKVLSRLTARAGFGIVLDNTTISIGHNSQWFEGRPFNQEFEYYSTSLNIDYKFSKLL